MTYSRSASVSDASLCEDVALSQFSPQESHFSPCTRMGSLNSARETPRHLPSVQRSETAAYELIPEAEREVVAKGHTCVRASRVYRGCCSTCTSPLESAAARPGSPRTSASRARSRMRGKVPHSVPLRRTSRSTLRTLTWSTPVCVDHQHLAWFGQVQRMPKYQGNAQSGIPGIVAGTDGTR